MRTKYKARVIVTCKVSNKVVFAAECTANSKFRAKKIVMSCGDVGYYKKRGGEYSLSKAIITKLGGL